MIKILQVLQNMTFVSKPHTRGDKPKKIFKEYLSNTFSNIFVSVENSRELL